MNLCICPLGQQVVMMTCVKEQVPVFYGQYAEDSTESNKSSFSPCLTAVFPYTQAHKQKNNLCLQQELNPDCKLA